MAPAGFETDAYITVNIEGNALRFRAKSLKIRLFICNLKAYPYCAPESLFVMVTGIRREAQI